ncbi:MAG: 30S ribosomal protein S12 methylthiotransferase RimO [Elusimicrobiota bacterium]|jgi:ribosomal protein S12 methylthiotransferase|nr:30S ribosomal protein S12 methylthiotransferase RimO [Elusimicrobiota bacterium]
MISPQNIAFIVLGCPKNAVEAEYMLGILKNEGFNIVSEVDKADIIVVHTCSFIASARHESESCIKKVLKLKKRKDVKVFVSGCLPQLIKNEMLDRFSGIDGYVGTGNLDKLPAILKNTAPSPFKPPILPPPSGLNNSKFRVLSSPLPFAYLKIAEGCRHKCSFCIIPQLRGKYQSRTLQSLKDESSALARSGIKELIIIAQDTTSYGIDLYGKFALSNLLKNLSKVKEIKRIRLLYAYPSAINNELLEIISSCENVAPYIDIPIQHISKNVLLAMKRPTNTRKIIEKIRSKYPKIVLRTSLIAGFPSESRADVKELVDFLGEGHFLYAGVFDYSNNSTASSAKLSPRVAAQEIKSRKKIYEVAQYEAFAKQTAEMKGTEIEILVENVQKSGKGYKVSGRSQFQAPEIDGKTVFFSKEAVAVGSFQTMVIDGKRGYTIKAREKNELT